MPEEGSGSREFYMSKVTSADIEQNNPKSNDWQSMYINMAKADPNLRFTTLAHRLTPEFLYGALKGLNRNAAPGPDRMTVPEYERDAINRIRSLHSKMVRGAYRASPVRRVYIPKPGGKLRPLGIANVEDRVVQAAIKNLLEPIYEQDFLDLSYGYRPGRSAHDALKALQYCISRRKTRYVVEMDIKGFFDNIEHSWLRRFLSHRIADRGLLRLIAKFLNAGVVDEGGHHQRIQRGTPQGGPLSPLLANIYLHYALDLWFDRRFRRTCSGVVEMFRYADDFVACFECLEDAQSFQGSVPGRGVSTRAVLSGW
jgi:group II intron reverse transcriptase/maturase